MDKAQILKNIFDNDTLGLLVLKPKTKQPNADDRLIASFLEVVEFYEENDREPKQCKDIQESKLFYVLDGIKADETKKNYLKQFDDYGLLETDTKQIVEAKQYNSINDILSDDSFGLLNIDNSIFTLTHVKPNDEREQTDFVARRKPCKDFSKYEPLFKQCHKDLKDGNRKYTKFSEDDIKQGIFFVVDGMLAYVAETYKITRGKHSKLDGRIKCIFENGTESNLLFRSLGKALYKNGQSVTELLNNTNLIINHINSNDVESGYIYILKTKSTNTQIQAIPNLYKIGFATTTVEERIKNASQDPTYLMAEVQIIASYKCYNLNPQKFENLIHTFFNKVCLSIDIFDGKGKRHTPREWFSVPLNMVEKAVELLISGDIIKYKYDDEREIIISLN